MVDKILFEHFATLATAPEGIARLRELILQLAVQGKLGTQDAGDEPAYVLLKKIISERKNKKKKNTTIDTISEDSFPYKIPDNWLWIRLDEIIDEVQPGFACGERDSKGIVQLRMNNINPRGDFIWEKILRVPVDEGQKQKFELRSGDILFNNTNSRELVGKSGLFKSFKEPIVFSNHFTRLRVVENRIDPAFVTLWLHSQWNSKIFEKICNKWIGQAAVNGNKLLAFQFPLPPLAEQHRIVSKVDRLMALCDELEARQQQEWAGCLRLGTASFAGLQNAESPEEFGRQWAHVCVEFDLILDCPENITVLRQTILQLAVQGKLETQDPGDEPASVLLERIRTEKERLSGEGKIKKGKSLKISDSENTLEILPNSWEWTRLSQIGLVNPRNCNIAEDKDVSFIPMTLIPVGYKKPVQQEIKKWGEIKSGFTHFADNDVVMAKITPCFQNGKSVVLKNLKNGVGAGTTELHVFRSIKNLINPGYILLFLKTPLFLEEGIRNMTGSAGQKRVPGEYFSETPFPLPPLAEQYRIVEKVDALMILCDILDAQLKKRLTIQTKFADAIIKNIGIE